MWLALPFRSSSNRVFAASSNINNKSNNCVTLGLVSSCEPRVTLAFLCVARDFLPVRLQSQQQQKHPEHIYACMCVCLYVCMFVYMSSFGSNPLCSYSRRQNAIRRKKDNQEKKTEIFLVVSGASSSAQDDRSLLAQSTGRGTLYSC